MKNKKMCLALGLAIYLGSAQLPGVSLAAAQPDVAVAAQMTAAAVTAGEPGAIDAAKYAGYIWRLDAKNREQLPRNFRTVNSAYRMDVDLKKTGKDFVAKPTREGLSKLNMSGSAQFSAGELAVMVPVLKAQAKGPIYIVDLRQEAHGFVNGDAVSWYGAHDWGNIGKTHAEALKDEHARLRRIRGKVVTVAKLNGDKKPILPRHVKAEQVMDEQQLARKNGLRYYRITATDHIWPSPEHIDAFIAFSRKLPKDAWLHFHCQAGQGRTTTYMALYDMMKNPQLPLADIVSRQYLLGGADISYTIAQPKPGQWKAPYYEEKARMLPKFYAYVQANYADGFRTTWSQWLREHPET